MAEDQETVHTGALKASPSLLYNNLASSGDLLAYGHHNEVYCLEIAPTPGKQPPTASQPALSAAENIHSVVFFTVDDEALLGVASGMGLQIWRDGGAHLIYHWVTPSTGQKQANDVHTAFARGICITSTSDQGLLLCVGTSSGTIYVFKIGQNGDSFEMIKELHGHEGPVLCLGSSYHTNRDKEEVRMDTCMPDLFSAEEGGKVFIWEYSIGEFFTIKQEICSHIPCISIGARGSCLIIGRQTGLIEIYSMNSEVNKVAEIQSHSRFMTALDIHPHKDLVATASQDCTMAVWSIPFNKPTNIKPVLSRCWVNRILTGIAFCGKGYDEVAVVAYDTEEIVLCKLDES